MSELFTYRKRVITSQDIDFLSKLIADNPQKSRNALSIMVCREWNWIQLNGVLKDGVCRGLMLKLHRDGFIKLPARKKPFSGGRQARRTIRKPDIDKRLICSTVKKIQPIVIKQVRRTEYEKLFNSSDRASPLSRLHTARWGTSEIYCFFCGTSHRLFCFCISSIQNSHSRSLYWMDS